MIVLRPPSTKFSKLKTIIISKRLGMCIQQLLSHDRMKIYVYGDIPFKGIIN